jgi:TonB-linked outer membrane protein, SusC/RagA family
MAQFYASISYYDETGMIKTNSYENYDSETRYRRYNFTTNVNLKITETTFVDIGAQGYLGDGNYPGESSGTIFSSTMEVNPVLYPKMFVIDGKEYVPGLHAHGGDRNPYADATKRGYRKTMNNKVLSNFRLTQELDMVTKGLKLTAMFAYDITNGREMQYRKGGNNRENTYYFADRNNPYDEQGRPILTTTWDQGSETLELNNDNKLTGERKDNFEVSLVYDRAFGDHRIGAMGIYTQQNRVVNNADNIINSIPYRLQGMAGRATYSWKDRYFGEFNVGYNGGENFPDNKRFGTFPAVGIGWVASNEKFWEPLNKVIPFFKIRYTNGKVGNSTVSDRRFMYLEQYEWKGDYGFTWGSNIGVDGIRVKNPATSLGWEVAHKQDLGLDLQMFDGDLNLTADFFKENREKILLKRENSLPGFAGFQEVPFGNVGKTKSKGFDATLEYRKRINEELTISVRGNFTYADPVWVDNDIPENQYSWRNRTGYSLVSVEGFTAKRLYTQNDIDVINAWYALPDAERSQTAQPFPTPYKVGLNQVRAGDIMYEDKNGDGEIDDDDISWLGNGDVPIINYGFGFNVDYKAISVGMLFQGTAKANRFVDGFVYAFNNSGIANVYDNIDDRWTEENPKQDVFYPRLAFGSDASGNLNNMQKSTWWLKDMSFLRLKTLQVSYRLPETWVRKVNLRNASVYMMGLNLFTISKWKLWDPELNTGNGTSYPNTTSYSIGINFSF